MLRTARVAILFSICAAVIAALTQSDERAAAAHDRPVGRLHQSRSVVLARNGIVATSHPAAASAGLDVLRSGGNAVDAAIAANAMLGVVEPLSCGIGGDLFAIYWDSKTQKLYGLNASGRSPYDLTREVFAERELDEIPIDGPLSWSVPGCVDGWQVLNERFGTRPLGELLEPAIETAEEGFPVSEVIAGQWQDEVEALKQWPSSAATYLVDGERAPRFGEMFHNPDLAATYRAIAAGGSDAFYRGKIAEQIVEYSRAEGGFFSLRDFAEHSSDWVDPVSTRYRGFDVWQLPPSGQGIAVLQMLNVLEQFDLSSCAPGDARFLHLFVEAKKLAFEDRAKYYADPDFGDILVTELISKEYARQRAAEIDEQRAATNPQAGDPRLARGDTVYLTVVDKDRNCCSLIQSVYYHFGSKMVPPGLGFVLQNRGALFALDDDHLNRLEPHKRPFHTIIPGFVTKDDQPWFCYGVMGGDMQPQGHVQVLVNMIDFGLNVQAAGDAPRVRHDGSSTPTGGAAKGAGTVIVESGIPDESIGQLLEKGHVIEQARSGFGGYQGILIDAAQGVLHGASESRKDGAALGY